MEYVHASQEFMRLEGVNQAFVDGTGLMQAAVQMLIKFIKGKKTVADFVKSTKNFVPLRGEWLIVFMLQGGWWPSVM